MSRLFKDLVTPVLGAVSLACAPQSKARAYEEQAPVRASPPASAAGPDTTELGVPFSRFSVQDRLGRDVTFYLSRRSDTSSRLPLVLFIQGSGCHSVFRRGPDRRLRGGYQNILHEVVRSDGVVMVVEKPGVHFLDDPGPQGTAEHCSEEFLKMHTVTLWGAALRAALEAAQALPGVRAGGVLVVGHSEGGIMAAHVAAESPSVAHVALISSTGPTQLFDLAEASRMEAAQPAGQAGNEPAPAEPQEDAAQRVFETFREIRKDPDSIQKFAWGHPYRRWSSFLSTSKLDELRRSKAKVYLVHGTNDRSVPVAAFDVLYSELLRDGRDVTAERIEGADHSLRKAGEGATNEMKAAMDRIIAWAGIRP